MKRFGWAIAVIGALFIGMGSWAVRAEGGGTGNETITIPKSMLNEKTLQTVEAELDAKKPWLGIGKEFAIGLNGAVDVLKSNVYEFAATPMGKATIVVVGYKIIGHDILRTALGIVMGIFFILAGFKCLRKARGTELYVKSKTGFWIFGKKEYGEREAIPDFLQDWYTGIGVIGLIAGTISLIVTISNI